MAISCVRPALAYGLVFTGTGAFSKVIGFAPVAARPAEAKGLFSGRGAVSLNVIGFTPAPVGARG